MYPEKLLRKQVDSEVKRRRYIVYTILFLTLIYVWASLLFGQRGLMRLMELNGKESSLRAEISEINRENERLREIMDTYQENDYYLEKNARENFGLAGKDEFIYLYEK